MNIALIGLPMLLLCYTMYFIGYSNGYDKAKEEEKEQSK
jgi:hypothetical protein